MGMRKVVGHTAVDRRLETQRDRSAVGRFGENKVIALGMVEAEDEGMLPDAEYEKRLDTARLAQEGIRRELPA